MPFVTIWEVTGSDLNITIPINPKYEYNYTVDWGDGNVSKYIDGNATHNYGSEGNYTVKISGKFPAIYLNNDEKDIFNNYYYLGNADKLIKIKKWGDIEWKSFERAFAGANQLEITASDTPNLKKVKDMSYALSCLDKNIFNNIEFWDVSNVSNHDDFATESPINGTSKMPNFE